MKNEFNHEDHIITEYTENEMGKGWFAAIEYSGYVDRFVGPFDTQDEAYEYFREEATELYNK